MVLYGVRFASRLEWYGVKTDSWVHGFGSLLVVRLVWGDSEVWWFSSDDRDLER